MSNHDAVSLVVSGKDIVLPGDGVGTLNETDKPAPGAKGSRPVVRLGSGITHRGGKLTATKAGNVMHDRRRSKIWVVGNQKRYEPVVEDAVVGVVTEKHAEEYRLDIHGTDTAVLSALAFEGATKRNKPSLGIGSAVYCRITSASKDTEVEASCVEPGSSRSWVSGETLYGELKGGNIVNVSIAFARSLQDKSPRVLGELGSVMRFEVAVGTNGRVWLKSDTVRNTIILCLLLGKADEMPFDKWQAHAKNVLSQV